MILKTSWKRAAECYNRIVGNISTLFDAWPLFLSAVFLVVWLVRLEGRVDRIQEHGRRTDGKVDTLQTKHEALDSRVVEQLASVRESLARIEGALGVRPDLDIRQF